MATVMNNALLNGLSGRLGQALVFKKYRGKKIVAQRSVLTKAQSDRQKANRNKFKDAAAFAKAAMLHASKKNTIGERQGN